MQKKIIIANWKMNPARASDAVALAKKIDRIAAGCPKAEIVVAPPALFLPSVGAVLKKAQLGSQNVFWKNEGPYTGEVSPAQFASVGVRYCIVGHSERRFFLGETDDMVNKKIHALLDHDLTPILCVGERERFNGEVPETVGKQIAAALANVKKSRLKNLVIAYEPVWAISTTRRARPAHPDDAFRASVYIRKIIAGMSGVPVARDMRIIYGGSVNAKNIAAFLGDGRMAGALVGSASLDAKEFSAIVRIAGKSR